MTYYTATLCGSDDQSTVYRHLVVFKLCRLLSTIDLIAFSDASGVGTEVVEDHDSAYPNSMLQTEPDFHGTACLSGQFGYRIP